MTIRIYTSEHCVPCKEVEDKIKQADTSEKIEVIDIETDEGFEKFKQEVLDHQDGAVPSAYRDGKQCKIGFDEERNLLLYCPTDEQAPVDEQPSSS